MTGIYKIVRLTVIVCFTAMTFAAYGQINQTDAQGRKHGEWIKKYENSTVAKYKGQFEHGEPVGKFVYFYPSNKVKTIVIHDEDSDRAEAYFYHENKELLAFGIYRGQKKDSVWTHYRPTGHLSFKETYENGELNGLKTTYYGPETTPGEGVLVLSKTMYKDGRAHGEMIKYFPDGKVQVRGRYKEGAFDGQLKRYHPNGAVMILERWKDREKHGWWITYDQSGQEEGRAYFRHGERLEGEELKKYMQKLKEKGINPNK